MRKLAPLALSAVALLALAGCAAGGSGESAAQGGGSSQSVADACAIAETKLTEAQSGLNDSLSAATSGDIQGVSDVVSTFQASFDEALSEISNSEVSSVLTTISDEYDKIGAAMEQLAAVGNDPAQLDKMTELSNEMTAVGERLQTASNELVELCG